KRLIFIEFSRRRSPSTMKFATALRIFATSGSARSLTCVSGAIPATWQICRALGRPIPKIDVSTMPTCLFSGMFMPAIRATFTFLLTLTLLMTRVGTNHPHHAVAADDFAVPAHFLDRCPDFHELYSETAEDSSAKLAAAPVIAQIGLLHHA